MLDTATRTAPTIRLRTPEFTAGALRRHLQSHNFHVLLIAAGTLLTAAAAWLALYFVCASLLVFVLAVGEVDLTHIPRGFPIVFAVAALCAVVYTWIDRRLTPNARVRDKLSPGEIVSDLLLMIPRMTISVGSTLAAWQRWNDEDFLHGAAVLHRIADEKRVPMWSLGQDITDPDAALRVLFGLQITQVIDVVRDGPEFWLKLSPLRPKSLRLKAESYADA